MGYRSEVLISIRGDRFLVETYRAKWRAEAEALMYPKDEYNEGDKVFNFEGNTEDLGTVEDLGGGKFEWLIKLEGVKWYDGYYDVDQLNSIWKKCPEQLEYEFLRIGENDDGIEHNFGGDNMYYVSRSIERY